MGLRVRVGLSSAVIALSAVGVVDGAHAASSHPARCATRVLQITLRGVPGGADHVGSAVRFENRGATCVMEGYPGVAGATASGRVVINARRSLTGYLGGARGISPIVLRRGATASALYEGLDAPVRGTRPCARYSTLLVTPPGDFAGARIRVTRGVCAPQIHPVVRGAGGSDLNARPASR